MKVIEYLRDARSRGENGLTLLEAEYGIRHTRHGKYPDLVLLKYDQIGSPSAHPLVVECRGLILNDGKNYEVVARPFDRFFNYGDGHAAEIDWSTAKVYEKADGSLMTLYHHEGEWQVSSSGVPDASGPVNNSQSKTFADLFWEVWHLLGYTLPDPEPWADHPVRLNYMFELMTPDNRVIVPHAEPRLVLLGVRCSEPPYHEVEPEIVADRHGWECVRSFPLGSFDAVVAACHSLNPMRQEGYVVRDAAFRRVKVKSPQYVALSHMKDGFSDRRMIDLVRSNEGDEFLAYFPECRPLYERTKAAHDRLVEDLEAAYEAIRHVPVQREFAIEATKSRLSGCLFALRAGKTPSVRDYLRDVSVQKLESVLRVPETPGR